jgi:hypothetical protein
MKLLAVELSQDGIKVECIPVAKRTDKTYFINGSHLILHCKRQIKNEEVGKPFFDEVFSPHGNSSRCDGVHLLYWAEVDDDVSNDWVQAYVDEIKEMAVQEVKKRERQLSLLKSKVENLEWEGTL